MHSQEYINVHVMWALHRKLGTEEVLCLTWRCIT